MPVDTDFSLAMADGICSVAPLGTPAPVGMAALTDPYVDLGAISTAGLTETLKESRTDFKRWGSIATFKSVITDETSTFDVNFIESNPNVLGVFYRQPAPTPSGAGTSAVQTVTVSGAPTGGTFTLDFGGQPTVDLAYNATAAQVQTALQALSTIGAGNVTVTLAGSVYTVTFGGALADAAQPQLVAVSNLTGGASPAVAVAVTTPGSSGSLLSVTDDTSGKLDVRTWVFDIMEGTNHIRFYVPRGEVTARKNPVYKTDSLIEYGVTITAYPTSAGVAVQRTFLLDAVVNG